VASTLKHFIIFFREHARVHTASGDDLVARAIRPLPWMMPKNMEKMVLIIGIPLVFIVMSMRALVRALAVMTGSSWAPYHKHPDGTQWHHVVAMEKATYTLDLELAVTFQFYAIWNFGELCGNFLAQSKYITASDVPEQVLRQYKQTLKWATIQSLYSFVIVGMARSLFDFVASVMQENPAMKATADKMEAQFMSQIGSVFTFVTILCVINMQIVCKMQDIRDKIGNATLKFHGTRLLLLVAQIQPQILNALTVGSPLYLKSTTFLQKHHLEKYLHSWTFTENQSRLLHAALLNYWCLFVAIFNAWVWKMKHEDIAGTLGDDEAIGAKQQDDYLELPGN